MSVATDRDEADGPTTLRDREGRAREPRRGENKVQTPDGRTVRPMATLLCPRCGDELPTQEPGLCDACYAEELDALDVPERTSFRVCTRCGSYDLGEGWRSSGEAIPEEELAADRVMKQVGAHVEARDVGLDLRVERTAPTRYRVDVGLTGTVRDEAVAERREVLVDVDRTTCDTCSKIAGGYYESVVQVRADGRDPREEELDRARSIAYQVAGEDYGDRETFVADVEPVTAGLDVSMSTAKAGEEVARRLVDEYGGRYDDSATLVGEDADGQELYRVTYAVRLPRYVAGDVVRVEGTPVLVQSVGSSLRGRHLVTDDRIRFDAAEAAPLGRIEEAEETTVVDVRGGDIQVIDPATHEATTLRKPAWCDAEPGGTVSALSTADGVVLVPPED